MFCGFFVSPKDAVALARLEGVIDARGIVEGALAESREREQEREAEVSALRAELTAIRVSIAGGARKRVPLRFTVVKRRMDDWILLPTGKLGCWTKMDIGSLPTGRAAQNRFPGKPLLSNPGCFACECRNDRLVMSHGALRIATRQFSRKNRTVSVSGRKRAQSGHLGKTPDEPMNVKDDSTFQSERGPYGLLSHHT
ncbi:hypothetical protein [Paraburkholderia tropica]|uniref:hypothetical protein n=1 Tax=Paraburkholderia tropica TaxID=92647 RepID=UPI000F555C3E|nr:hypothetical protein [Paraburkholderia tropica]RQN36251.1 hypothetical protein EHZ25_24860 [Paraburkholderia tropica]